jgi:hypothetical protein
MLFSTGSKKCKRTDDMNHSEEPLRVMIGWIPALAWSCLPDGTIEFLIPCVYPPVDYETKT